MNEIKNWLEQTFEIPFEDLCCITAGMLLMMLMVHLMIRIAIHNNMEFLKKYSKSDTNAETKEIQAGSTGEDCCKPKNEEHLNE